MSAASSASLSLPLDSAIRPVLLQSSPSSSSSSLALHRSHPIPLSLSSFHRVSGAIAACNSGGGGGGVFLDDVGLERLQALDNFIRKGQFGGGWLVIRQMEDSEVEQTVQLLAGSFAESMGMPPRYVQLLAFLVRQYVVERRFLVPHVAMLVGIYNEGGDKEPVLACTAEVSFDHRGANAAPPTPLPPRDFPYICNMAVKKELRRVADTVPLRMYKKAGYKIFKTDSILVWLTLQRRKHLLVKQLPIQTDVTSNNQTDTVDIDYVTQ
ncbi:hypothetical protein AXF42_Ash001644 [Apostasia shenzhenica]|uniref:Uncharacterized protein n=1 Tax=Apostasia shenzhenica TaxID=1088818 RepID=A0A2I0AAT6_9ASPA|nr:hypothetical protein AXF42_Ash001644 [Apostasia shenzhenica]